MLNPVGTLESGGPQVAIGTSDMMHMSHVMVLTGQGKSWASEYDQL